MSILKPIYELSVWKEVLNTENGTKTEIKEAIIGADDMSALGRATNIQLKRELKGTNTLTFQMPSKFFDSQKGTYVHNDLVDYVFNERKIKLKFNDEWYEFYVKKIDEKKNFKSIMYNYTCNDAFIDELSRNGYGITFDTELYNNVEEIGNFTDKILEDGTIWKYDATMNIGDFTEYNEEKLYKIPLSCFKDLVAYPVNIEIQERSLTNPYTKEKRSLQMGDDYARELSYFWDNKKGSDKDDPNCLIHSRGFSLFDENNKVHFSEDTNDYIYVPYNMLSYIYGHTAESTENGLGTEYDATAEPLLYDENDISKGYALRTFSNDYTKLIEFIYIPKDKELLIDEEGLIVNTDIQYITTVGDWNAAINSGFKKDKDDIKWKYVYYEGYLEEINGTEVKFGKNISITDRTEINVSPDIDRYTTVYNNKLTEYIDLWTNEDMIDMLPKDDSTQDGSNIYNNLWVCSYPTSRSIVPQLARNLIQNGNNITEINGWEVMKVNATPTQGTTQILAGTDNAQYYSCDAELSRQYYTIKYSQGDISIEFKTYANSINECYQIIADFKNYINENLQDVQQGNFFKYIDELKEIQDNNNLDKLNISTGNFSYNSQQTEESNTNGNKEHTSSETGLIVKIPYFDKRQLEPSDTNKLQINPEQSIINFGIVGQEVVIEKHKMYAFKLILGTVNNENITSEINLSQIIITIGNGNINGEGYYSFEYDTCVQFTYADYLSAISSNYSNYLLLAFSNVYTNPYIAISFPNKQCDYKIMSAEFFEAYTRGYYGYEPRENEENFSTMEEASKYLKYLYTGRDFNYSKNNLENNSIITNNLYYSMVENEKDILKETDISLGEVFEYERYYSQCLKFKPFQDPTNFYNDYNTFNNYGYLDTFKLKSFVDDTYNTSSDKEYMDTHPFIGLNAAHYTEDDYEIVTNYLNLNKCSYYKNNNIIEDYLKDGDGDCNHPNSKDHICLYQKSGYCPYRFQTEKHCRRIRTLNGEKSNRFNLIQETSKVFEVYPNFYIDHDINTGKINKDKDGTYIKRVFYMTEKGMENKIGFRYEKNLKDISRSIDSNNIVTKLYVEDVDSELSDTGLCSIKLAEDNPSKDSFLIDFSYYEMKGLMDKESTENYLYGNGEEKGYLKELGNLNTEYDKLSNLIINMQDESYTELQANIEVNLTGIETSLTELNKCIEKINKYYKQPTPEQTTVAQSDTYNNYVAQFMEQINILCGLIASTFGNTNDQGIASYSYISFMNPDEHIEDIDEMKLPPTISEHLTDFITNKSSLNFLYGIIMNYKDGEYKSSWRQFKEKFLDNPKNYPTTALNYGLFGQYVSQYLKIQEWKKERSQYLVQINKLSQSFYRNYEPFLKEGTWTDSNYLSDNTYYWGAKSVIADGCKPKITYNISVIDLYNLPNHEDYKFNLGDTTYVEDIETFGVNQKTGLPNKIKVLISTITYNLDNPTSNTIGVQNYTTQFEDLFGQISASVQSLTFNENTYKRASNFTATKNVEGESLQGALDENQLTLMDTDESNIVIDTEGQSGSDINNHAYQYKLSGEGLFFSKNGGQSWDIGVTPKGINADYIKVGALDASKVQIIDGEYLYFLWDKTGITAYRDPKLTNTDNGKELFGDFARFNKYGLSIVENNKIKLRAGYKYTPIDSEAKGDIRKEQQSINQDTVIGFYLYDSNGNSIFQTEQNNPSNDDNGGQSNTSAKISLIGEMQIADTVLVHNSYTYSYKYSGQITIKYTGGIYQNNNILNDDYDTQLTQKYSTDLQKVIEKIAKDKNIVITEYKIINETDGQTIKCTNNDQIQSIETTVEYTISNGTTGTITLLAYKIITNDNNNGTIYYPLNPDDTIIITDLYTIQTINQNSKYEIETSQENISTSPQRYASAPITITNENGSNSQITVYATSSTQLRNFSSNPNNGDTLTCYQHENIEVQTSGDTISSPAGARLLLNNTNVTTETRNANERLLSSLYFTPSGAVNNIFTILKNGDLYIGGQIVNSITSEKIPEELEISSAPLYYDGQNASLNMNFNTIKNDNGVGLEDYIVQVISDMRNTIVEWATEGINNALGTAGDAQGSVEALRSEFYSFKNNTYSNHTHEYIKPTTGETETDHTTRPS